MFKKNEENQSIEGSDAELMFSNRFLVKLLWPLFVEQFLIFAVGLVDSVMVASVGEAAVSAVSLVDSIMALLITVMTALATGGAVVVGQFLGQKKKEEAGKAADQLLLFVLVLSLFIIAFMYIMKDLLLDLTRYLRVDEVMAYCNTYYLIVVASVPFIAVYNVGSALFRSTGNSKMSMNVSLLMNAINVAGNAMLIYGFHRGVEGVAIPTLVSRAVAALIMYVCLRNQNLEVHISRRFVFKFNGGLVQSSAALGIPNGVENSMFQLGKLILLSLVSGFGTASIAANAVSNAVAMIAVLPGMAVGYGIVSVISRCVGSGDYIQVKYYAVKLIKWAYMLLIIVNVVIVLLIPVIMNIYGLSEETASIASKIILFHSIWAVTIWPLSFSIPNVLRAASDSRALRTMVVGVGSMWIFRICCGFLLEKHWGLACLVYGYL